MIPSQVTIETQIDDAFANQVSDVLLIEAAATTLRHQNVHGPLEMTVAVVGDAQVRRLNREYLAVDETTDVLAFADEESDFVSPVGVPRYLGDVIISFERARKQADRAGHPVAAELQLLIVHAVLHLLGHDHAEPTEKTVMWEAQAAVLGELGAAVVDPTPAG